MEFPPAGQPGFMAGQADTSEIDLTGQPGAWHGPEIVHFDLSLDNCKYLR